jgi:hypothetical protein
MIRAIYAVPPTKAGEKLLVRLHIRRNLPIPYFPARKLTVPYSDISLKEPYVSTPAGNITPAQAKLFRQQQELLENTSFFSAPLSHLSRGLHQAFRILVRVWTRDGFMKLKINGKGGDWKLDRETGWALESGRAVDRLFLSKVTTVD